jgi:sulfite exporter TauE/SafE
MQTTTQVNPEVDVGEIAGQCAGKVAGAVLAVAGATKLHLALGILSGLKAGFDIGECALETIDESSRRAAEALALEACVDAGGTTLGAVNGVLTCEMPLEKAEEDSP